MRNTTLKFNWRNKQTSRCIFLFSSFRSRNWRDCL